MRIYQNFKEALSEIKRDLAEMGIITHSKSYQDRIIKNNINFQTREITNYIYTVGRPKLNDLKPTQPWADAEFSERVSGESVNPGQAYKYRNEVWFQFLDVRGQFSYTYSERLDLCDQVSRVVDRIREDQDSRQLYLSVWQTADVTRIGGQARVPCSLGYYFKVTQGRLDMTYLQRSADFVTHLENDIYLAYYLQTYMATRTELLSGNFTHWIGSLHIFQKDCKEIF
jgi:thymidylate synthase